MENNDAKVEDDVFSKENNSVLRIKDFLESAESKDKSEIITEFQNVLTEYQSVIQDSAKLTKISDTTQNRLKKTKDQLKDLNDSLVDKNNNLTLLGQVGKLVTSTLDVKEILFTIYNSIKPFVTIEILTLGLIEEQQNC
ncbi:MAG: hypothetical protein JJT78_04020, partial [Leptospira sp.]|nr:hypothetical protein [Leptospira sp.]